jgi:Neuraminidase (sialidase)
MSVEGDKIVVAWAGAQTAHAWPFEGDPSDIYYATSKDGGKTWKKPLKVTDRFKDGITSGSARVALQNGVIHLFYAQGKWDNDTQVNHQGGWPVYYQQRAFPD